MAQYTMHNDPTRFPEPEKFNVSRPDDDLRRSMFTMNLAQPDRYVNDHYSNAESANLADPYQRDHWMFGAGYAHDLLFF